MGRKRITTGAGGKIRIKRSSDDSDSPDDGDRLKDDQTDIPGDRIPDGAVGIPEDTIINFMETRAESQLRPGEEDVETVYALTGTDDSTAETPHAFSSSQIISATDGETISYRLDTLLQHLRGEREAAPSLVVLFHTHPSGVPRPSDQDRRSWKQLGQRLQDEWPDARILFGIHAMMSEFDQPRSRNEPTVDDSTSVVWRSISRDHACRVYTPDARPVEVVVL